MRALDFGPSTGEQMTGNPGEMGAAVDFGAPADGNAVPSPRRPRFLRGGRLLGGLVALVVMGGCATTGDLRKLEERLIDATAQLEARPEALDRLAELAEEVEQLKSEQRRLEGLLDVAQKTADDALAEAGKARASLAMQSSGVGEGAAGVAAGAAAAGMADDEAGPADPVVADEATSAEVLSYQEALTAWRSQDHEACIDRFRKFLQTYPASPYADDAAYWMADCHFKKGDYRVAVLRFNDVVRVYPTGSKAPDALYRQGESLLQLGPNYYDAAKSAFEKVLKDYPESGRAKEAEEQLEAISSG